MFNRQDTFDPIYITDFNDAPQGLQKDIRDVFKMSDQQLDQYIWKCRDWFLDMWNNHKYPVCGNMKNKQRIIDEFRKFNKLDVSSTLKENNVLYGFNRFGTGVNNWFPQMFDTVINKNKDESKDVSIIDSFRDKASFHKKSLLLLRRDRMRLWTSGANKELKVYKNQKDYLVLQKYAHGFRLIDGNQQATNFPTHMGKYLYSELLKDVQSDELNVFDPCMGWGGRLLSLLSIFGSQKYKDKNLHLIGTDVNTQINPNQKDSRYKMVIDFWQKHVNPTLKSKLSYNILNVPAQSINNYNQFINLKGKGDLVLTSPPYFNRQKYSKDETQSYKMYTTYQDWRDGFLKGLINNSYQYLKINGILALNIANIKVGSKILSLEQDTIRFAQELGFKLQKVYNMVFSIMAGTNKNLSDTKIKNKLQHQVQYDGKLYKTQPMFIFKKVK